MDYYKRFHEQISNAVELSEFTQKQIAGKVNITESSLSKYLNNKQSLDMNTIFWKKLNPAADNKHKETSYKHSKDTMINI